MDLYCYLSLGALLPALAAAFYLSGRRRKTEKNQIPDICMGAIRVTRDGRNMLIVRKEDGSFEMIEEQPSRNRRPADPGLSE